MAEMLTYHNGHSTAYVWNRHRRLEYADENFAREICQLFTIGLVKLNDDGTAAGDPSNPVLTYSNEDISEYARMWTGLVRQPRRGNIEDPVQAGRNQIDPMRINMEVKDYFPKVGLRGSSICPAVPVLAFLKDRFFSTDGTRLNLCGRSSAIVLRPSAASFSPERCCVSTVGNPSNTTTAQ